MALTSCGPAPTGTGDLARAKEIKKTCPADIKIAALINMDVSGSGRLPDVGTERLGVIEDTIRHTAICGGHLAVTVFSATSAATVALYDGELSLPGATENARLRRVEKVVHDVSEQASANYPAAIKKISPAHSDILGQLRLASEYQQQLGSSYQLNLILLTDGLQTIGPRITTPIAVADSREVAKRVIVPPLKGASVTVAGVGKVVAGGVPSSALTNSLVAYWQEVCRRSAADRCTVVTDYTTGR
ncbi:hypothetical protein AB0P21_20765 [Kribbella sp. NPDC056861]|uniref:hypothetical protein n=1 Tax=Kribbella sp. NPDC056861 TaxID=3154857 RepID=UPI00341FE0FD